MKKVVHINVGGKAFTINEDAYIKLEKYLNALEKHFSKSEGFEGIIYDIEIRISELFEENNTSTIVDIPMVDRIIKTMGSPEDFSDDIDDNPKKKSSRINIKTGKKLFRDTDNQIIGGVAAGISAYFGISDPLVVRLVFVFFTLVGGSGFLAYILMWAIIPKAKTSSDYLAMRGEEINIDNIAKTVQDGLSDLKDKLEDISKGFKTKIL